MDANKPTFIAELRITFYLQGCRSLKEKRQRLAGLRDRFGRLSNLAVCECGFQDVHQRSCWSFVSNSSDKRVVESILRKVELFAVENLDATVTDISLEFV